MSEFSRRLDAIAEALEAVETVGRVLTALGVELPLDPTQEDVETSFAATTDTLGEALLEDLVAGSYKCKVLAANHQEYTCRVWVKPGITVSRDIFLEYNLVTVEWEVNEITILDKYEILLTATFETDVPAAVVVAEDARTLRP